MPRLDRAQIETIEARLVKRVIEEDQMRSTLNLDDGVEVDAFMRSRIGEYDVFAFPLRAGDGGPIAALVLYLGENSQPLGGEDLPALGSIGHMFPLVGAALRT